MNVYLTNKLALATCSPRYIPLMLNVKQGSCE